VQAFYKFLSRILFDVPVTLTFRNTKRKISYFIPAASVLVQLSSAQGITKRKISKIDKPISYTMDRKFSSFGTVSRKKKLKFTYGIICKWARH
jgi:hypothetical protein